MSSFKLHPQLQQDSVAVGCLELCELRLMNDCQYPWFILIPQRADMREIYQLTPADQQQLQQESCFLAEHLATLYQADKLNIAAIGNLVPQLHIHHIVRFRQDKAWPAPIWGKFTPLPYSDEQLAAELSRVREALKLCP